MSTKPGRNDPCSCGSGKKYKHCCAGKAALPPAPPPAEINHLATLFNAGRHAELGNRARSLLGRYPDHGVTWHLLGASLQIQGKDGLDALRKAAELLPGDAGVHNNLGNALSALGHPGDAVASYRRALEIKPDFAMAHGNLGNALNALGQFGDAAAACYRALALAPDYAEAHNNLGVARQAQGLFAEAETSYRRALEIKPDYAEAHNNLCIALNALGQFGGAAAACHRALEIKPDFAEAYNSLGNALNGLGQLDDAVSSYRRALEIEPGYADAHSNLGAALQTRGRLAESEASCRRALEIEPGYADAYNNLGSTLHAQGRLAEAEASYRRALEIRPGYAEAYSNLLFAMNYTVGHSPAHYLEHACRYGRMAAEKVGTRFSAWRNAAHPERLRVGLVSGDLRVHSVGYFLEGLLSHIDPARIELIAYPTNLKEDDLTTRIRPYFSAWKPLVGQSDEAAARSIHADGAHVLLDISGHTAHNRLPVFAWKPAPVQVTWLGLPGTTGVGEMDYVLGDPVAIPPGHENHFSETVWRLPCSYLCFSAPADAPDVSPLPALSAGRVTFGSFNNLAKMNDAVVERWARILLSVPGSRLYLKAGQLNDAGIREQSLRRFAAYGIAPERLLLRGTSGSIADHLSEYSRMDVALDTFPYPGVTTSVEALWMGVPVLTLHGDRFLSLTAESIARHAGLPDWVAADGDDYVSKAVAFTSDLGRLSTLRAGLRQRVRSSPVFDAQRFARDFEDALWGMWRARVARGPVDG